MALKNYRKIESGRIFDAFFSEEEVEVTVTVNPAFGRGWPYEKKMQGFEYKGKTYVVRGFDHFNAHFSGFRDRATIYGIFIAELC